MVPQAQVQQHPQQVLKRYPQLPGQQQHLQVVVHHLLRHPRVQDLLHLPRAAPDLPHHHLPAMPALLLPHPGHLLEVLHLHLGVQLTHPLFPLLPLLVHPLGLNPRLQLPHLLLVWPVLLLLQVEQGLVALLPLLLALLEFQPCQLAVLQQRHRHLGLPRVQHPLQVLGPVHPLLLGLGHWAPATPHQGRLPHLVSPRLPCFYAMYVLKLSNVITKCIGI